MKNSKGKIYYGMHFYPGVAEYQEPGKDPYRVYLNEDTIRSMDPSFAGRPIFVEHVDEVNESIDELRKEADGWVVESFYNQADGKHWVKFIAVSERAEKAIQVGMRLSNAYIPKSFGQGGQWNGVAYAREITGGEYEHLAIVRNPRYEESVILTPDEFKLYNENKIVELKRLSNSKETKGENQMPKFSFFKRQKVENAIDLEGMSVVLPKSKKEMTIEEVINAADAVQNMDGYANMDHMVKIHDGSEMKVGDLVAKHKAMNDEMESMKAKKEDSDEEIEEGEKEVGDRGGDKGLENKEDEEKKKDLKLDESEEKEVEDAKKKNAKEKAERLKNAHLRQVEEKTVAVEFSGDKVARGKSRYGSN